MCSGYKNPYPWSNENDKEVRGWIHDTTNEYKRNHISTVSIISFLEHQNIYSFSLLRKRTAMKRLTWTTTWMDELRMLIMTVVITLQHILFFVKMRSPFPVAYCGTE